MGARHSHLALARCAGEVSTERFRGEISQLTLRIRPGRHNPSLLRVDSRRESQVTTTGPLGVWPRHPAPCASRLLTSPSRHGLLASVSFFPYLLSFALGLCPHLVIPFLFRPPPYLFPHLFFFILSLFASFGALRGFWRWLSFLRVSDIVGDA